MPSIEKSIVEIKDTSKPEKAVGDAPKFSTMKLVFIVNVVQIGYTARNALGKDLLSNYGVGILEFSFLRSLLIFCTSFVFIKK